MGKAAIPTEITFAKQLNGYDREQVDRYVEMLSGAYRAVYEKLAIKSGKYNNLLKKYTELEKQSEQNRTNADALTKSLVDAEMLAQSIITGARTEAEKIKAAALAEAERIKGDACIERMAAKRSVEAANESLAQTIYRLQNLVAPLD